MQIVLNGSTQVLTSPRKFDKIAAPIPAKCQLHTQLQACVNTGEGSNSC